MTTIGIYTETLDEDGQVDTQVYKQFVEDESFKRFVGNMVYATTNQAE